MRDHEPMEDIPPGISVDRKGSATRTCSQVCGQGRFILSGLRRVSDPVMCTGCAGTTGQGAGHQKKKETKKKARARSGRGQEGRSGHPLQEYKRKKPRPISAKKRVCRETHLTEAFETNIFRIKPFASNNAGRKKKGGKKKEPKKG